MNPDARKRFLFAFICRLQYSEGLTSADPENPGSDSVVFESATRRFSARGASPQIDAGMKKRTVSG